MRLACRQQAQAVTPLRHPNQQQEVRDPGHVSSKKRNQVKRCGLCAEDGHTKPTCPWSTDNGVFPIAKNGLDGALANLPESDLTCGAIVEKSGMRTITFFVAVEYDPLAGRVRGVAYRNDGGRGVTGVVMELSTLEEFHRGQKHHVLSLCDSSADPPEAFPPAFAAGPGAGDGSVRELQLRLDDMLGVSRGNRGGNEGNNDHGNDADREHNHCDRDSDDDYVVFSNGGDNGRDGLEQQQKRHGDSAQPVGSGSAARGENNDHPHGEHPDLQSDNNGFVFNSNSGDGCDDGRDGPGQQRKRHGASAQPVGSGSEAPGGNDLDTIQEAGAQQHHGQHHHLKRKHAGGSMSDDEAAPIPPWEDSGQEQWQQQRHYKKHRDHADGNASDDKQGAPLVPTDESPTTAQQRQQR
eukprot:m.461245 g.461245  ORF g.461245 m.461245 type:complete len:408 (+) comp20346_c1_seq6:3009-4232(+)